MSACAVTHSTESIGYTTVVQRYTEQSSTCGYIALLKRDGFFELIAGVIHARSEGPTLIRDRFVARTPIQAIAWRIRRCVDVADGRRCVDVADGRRRVSNDVAGVRRGWLAIK